MEEEKTHLRYVFWHDAGAARAAAGIGPTMMRGLGGVADAMTGGVFDFDKQGDEGKRGQDAESGAYYATYAIGNVSLGYSKGWRAELMADATSAVNATDIEQYDQSNMSVAYAINDDLSVSYEVEKSTAVTGSDTDADVEQKSTGIQLAYNMGGMTLALVRNSHDNPSYSATAADEDQTLIAVTMAF